MELGLPCSFTNVLDERYCLVERALCLIVEVSCCLVDKGLQCLDEKGLVGRKDGAFDFLSQRKHVEIHCTNSDESGLFSQVEILSS